MGAARSDAAAPLSSEMTDLQVLRNNFDVREYRIGTEKRIAPLVIGLKKIIEAAVKPYAGHFLDKQAHYNEALNRIVTSVLARLDSLNDQFLALRNEQKAVQELIANEMADVRNRLEVLGEEMAERDRVMHAALTNGLEDQTKRQMESDRETQKALKGVQQEFAKGLNETSTKVQEFHDEVRGEFGGAVQHLQTRLAEIEKKTIKGQEGIENKLARELEAVVDFLEEILASSS